MARIALTLKMAKELKPGEAFDYVFDFGDDWRHCAVEPGKVDPLEWQR